MKTQTLSIDLLRIDAGTQSRVAINEDTVEEYSELINGTEWPFPPLEVFHDGTDYFVGDGFHRYFAGKRSKRGSFPCNVHDGTATDAKIFGMTANDRHGLRMTREDKRSCVEWLLDNGGKMTQVEVADKAGVSERTVRYIVADRKTSTEPPKASDNGKIRQIAGLPSKGEVDPFEEQEANEEPVPKPKKDTETPEGLGRCPNCASKKWYGGYS